MSILCLLSMLKEPHAMLPPVSAPCLRSPENAAQEHVFRDVPFWANFTPNNVVIFINQSREELGVL